MGLVHAVQQGKVPASKVSKSARDAAKQMKKSDVEDFADTKEKGLPKKVRESLESDEKTGYLTMMKLRKKDKTAFWQITKSMGSDWGKLVKKAKKKGWTKLKESVNESSYHQKQIIDFIKKNKQAVKDDPSNMPRIKLFGVKGDTNYLNISLDALSKLAKIMMKESVNEEIIDWQGKYDDNFKFKKGMLVKDINPDCPHHGSEGEVTKVSGDELTYTVRNNGDTYEVGDELTKTKEQLIPLSLGDSVND